MQNIKRLQISLSIKLEKRQILLFNKENMIVELNWECILS